MERDVSRREVSRSAGTRVDKLAFGRSWNERETREEPARERPLENDGRRFIYLGRWISNEPLFETALLPSKINPRPRFCEEREKERKRKEGGIIETNFWYRGHAFPKETGRNYRRYTTRPITSNCPGAAFNRAPPIAGVNESSVNFNSDPVSGHILHIPHPLLLAEERAALKPTTPTAYTHACVVHVHRPRARTTILPPSRTR